MKDFAFSYESVKPPPEVLRECIGTWTGQLSAHNYALTSQSEAGLTYSRRYRSWIVIAAAVLTFPLGLLFLLITQDASIAATLTPHDGGTTLDVHGKGPKKVIAGFETMEV